MTKALSQLPWRVSVEIWLYALCCDSSPDIGRGGMVIENLQLVAQIALSYLHSQGITHKWQMLFMRRLTFVSSFRSREYVAVLTKYSGFLFFSPKMNSLVDWFLGAFAKLRKETMCIVMCVRLSVRVKQLGSHWKDFHEIWYLRFFFENMSKKSKFH